MPFDNYHHQLSELISDLVATGDIEEGTKEYGISLQVIDKGYESLSPKQQFIYDQFVSPKVAALATKYEVADKLRSWPE